MAEQHQEKKKFITFKPGVRPELFKALIFMGIMIGVMMISTIPFGLNNGLACGFAFISVLMSLSNDYTLEPVRNTFILIASNVGMVVLAFLSYGLFPEGTSGYIVTMTVFTFITFFLAIFLFTSEKHNSTYMPLLLAFSMFIFYPVYGMDLFIRIAIYAVASVISIILNVGLRGKTFKKKTGAALNGAIATLKKQCLGIYDGSSKEELVKQYTIIDKTLSGIEAAYSTKMSIDSEWKPGHDTIRTITILKRINNTLSDNYVTGDEVMSADLHSLIIEVLDSIDCYEQNKISSDEILSKFDALYLKLDPEAGSPKALDSIRMEMDDFVNGEVERSDMHDNKPSIGSRILNRFNRFNFVFALNVSILAGIGVFLATFFGMYKPYIIPMYIGIVAKPYAELNKSSVINRIINTIYAVGLIMVAFSITNNTWVHLVALIAITLFADMFFQFDGSTMLGSMISVLMTIIMEPVGLYSFSLYRLVVIIALCIALLLVNSLVYPKSIPETLRKQLQYSVSLNDEIREAFKNEETTYDTIHDIIRKNRAINQKLRTINVYAVNPDVTAYLMAEEEWLNRLTIVNHRLLEENAKLGDFIETVEGEKNLTPRQKSIIISINEIADDIIKTEEIALKVLSSEIPEAVNLK